MTGAAEPADTAPAPGTGNPVGQALDRLGRRPGRAFLLLFLFFCAVQGFFLSKVSERYIEPDTRWELPAIAVSLAEKGAFADPFALPTGPTAHLPPIPPAIFGLSYKVFGLNLAGGYGAWIANIAIYAALWAMLPWVAGALGLGGGAGVVAGVIGGVIPRWSDHGEGLAALALGLLMVAFLRRWTAAPNDTPAAATATPTGALLLGAAGGVAFHVQPALLPVFLGWMAFELWWRRDRGKWLHAGLLALGIVLACLPWGVRNYRAFDAVFFIRSNFGLELRMGNHEGVAASFDVMDRRGEEYIHPRALEREARKVQEMGEVRYMRDAGREAMDWIRENPGEFAGLTASRAAHWWLGPLDYPPGAFLVTLLTLLALVGAWLAFPGISVPQRAAVLIPLLTFPLVYYVVAYMPRYREPVDWIFLLIAAAAITHAGQSSRRSPSE